MKIEQIKLRKMSTFCYVIGDESTGDAALIDPAFNVKMILDRVHSLGFKVTTLINTHHHADHSAGNMQVIKETKAVFYIHKSAARGLGTLAGKVFSKVLGGRNSPPPHVMVSDGDKIPIGSQQLLVLHTPGHTKGDICLYTPGHVFTGDTLFVGAVGRSDLPGGNAKTLLASIRKKIYSLPEDTIVWPGHDYGVTPNSTVVYERKNNPFTRG